MIAIEMDLAQELDTVNADAAQLQQVMMNLALNARDAMPEGGKLLMKTQNISLDAHYCGPHLGTEPGDYVLLSISDSGCGMDKETLNHVFDPFLTTKAKGKGTGLGLSTVYGIVKNHGGIILCYSEPGVGTTFKVYLPVISEERETESRKATEPLMGGTETILIVDDEESVRKVGQTILSEFGYSVLTASNALEGLEILAREEGRISLVIMDLIMPEMGGLECLRKIMAVDPSKRVLIASGYAANGKIEGPLKEEQKAQFKSPITPGNCLISSARF